jgi:hypothetical protein
MENDAAIEVSPDKLIYLVVSPITSSRKRLNKKLPYVKKSKNINGVLILLCVNLTWVVYPLYLKGDCGA